MAGRYIPSKWPSDNTSSDDDETGHPGFNYSRHGIDNSRSSALYHDHPTVVLLRIVSEVYLSMPIALFGVIGNLVSLVVLSYYRRLKKLHAVVIQLQALAVVDTLILVTILMLRFFNYFSLARPNRHRMPKGLCSADVGFTSSLMVALETNCFEANRPNGNTLGRYLAAFTGSAITPPTVNRFG